MFCPRCSSQAVEGQRYCKNCGMNLGVILDAFEGKQRGPLDFENLKRDLRELGSSLRTGFEEASSSIKKTQRLEKQRAEEVRVQSSLQMPNWSAEFNKALRKVKAANSRKYSLQQATLSIFGGGTLCYVWYLILQKAASSSVIDGIEHLILNKLGTPIVGLGPVIASLWVLGLIPVARGVAHLVNGLFFAPKPIEESQETVYTPPVYAPQVIASGTNDLDIDKSPTPQMSVTEDPTLRFEPREAKQ